MISISTLQEKWGETWRSRMTNARNRQTVHTPKKHKDAEKRKRTQRLWTDLERWSDEATTTIPTGVVSLMFKDQPSHFPQRLCNQ